MLQRNQGTSQTANKRDMNLGSSTPKSMLSATTVGQLPQFPKPSVRIHIVAEWCCYRWLLNQEYLSILCTSIPGPRKKARLMMFSQNPLAESWYVSSNPLHSLLALVERRLGGSGNQAYSLEVSGKLDPTSDPAGEVRTGMLQRGGDLPHPTEAVDHGDGVIVGQARMWRARNLFCLHSESRADEQGKASHILKTTCSLSIKDGCFTRFPLIMQLGGRRGPSFTSPLNPQEREQGRAVTEPHQQWARISDSCDLVSIPNFKREKPWTSYTGWAAVSTPTKWAKR